MPDLDDAYDTYPRIEEQFLARLDESLDPRGPDYLFELVAGLGLPQGAKALDLGCGEGSATIELAQRFGFDVLGVDPVARNLEVAAASVPYAGRGRVRFAEGRAEAIPAEAASIDLIWSKEVLVLVDKLDEAFAECRRVLKPDGRMVCYQVLPAEHLEPDDPAGFTTTHATIEAAFARQGFVAEQTVDLKSEGGEWSEETNGTAGRRLIHAARLLRQPDRYIAEFGQQAYGIMLQDAFWHIHRMIGKTAARAYVLRAG
jgi:SAM-dependent methyltransferase